MRFYALSLAGAFRIDIEPIRDHRGFNARSFCACEFAAHGLRGHFVQTNVIANGPCGTLRGFHYQIPHAEAKLFRVTRGAIHDVIIDLRPSSPTYRSWLALELAATTITMLYVPDGFAQGFQTLAYDTELTYQVSAPYAPEYGRGIRHDDQAFAIPWPLEPTAISERDLSWPDFEDAAVRSVFA
jgi:dTDP-4-dehydrorhamnose 3,5-epimerase